MTKQIDEKTIVRIMREEWTSRKQNLLRETKDDEKEKTSLPFDTVSIGLKIKHKETGILYTVNRVSPGAVTLRDPEGMFFVIPNASIEAEYELS